MDRNDSLLEKDNRDVGGIFKFIILFYFLGTICYVPHNFYVTANEYWMYKFRDTGKPFNASDTEHKTNLQKNFTAYANIAGSVGMVVFMFITIYLRNRISLNKRIIGGMVSMVLLFLLTLLFILVDTDSWQTGFFVIALVIGALLFACSAILLVSLFQLAFKFPPRCLAAEMAGQSVCGILGALIQIVALAAAPSVKSTASLHFTIAIGTVAGVLVAYVTVLKRSGDFQNYSRSKPRLAEGVESKPPKFVIAVIINIVKKLALLVTSVVLCVGNSGILHSGLTSLIESSGKGTNIWSDTYFIPVAVFLSFNTFQFVGREVSNHLAKVKNVRIIFAISIISLALFPLILLCNIQPRHHLPVVFHDDVYFIIFVVLLAFSSGHLVNTAILVQPEICEENERIMGTLVIVLVIVIFGPIFSVISGVIVNII